MAGHMGDSHVTIQNLQVVKTDINRGLIMIKGAVPGAKGGWVTLKDAVKKVAPANLPYPTARDAEDDEDDMSETTKSSAENNEEITASAVGGSETVPSQEAVSESKVQDEN